jgi:hypothetical protein
MTFRRRLIVLSSVLLVLVLAYIVGSLVSPRPGGERREPLLPGFSPESVTAISVSDSEGNVRLDGQNDAWTMELSGRRFPARSDRIEVLLEDLAEAHIVREVTDREEMHDELGVGGDAIRLGLTTGSTTTELLVGDESTGTDLLYVRFPDSRTVYSTDGRFRFYLNEPATYFAYLRVFPEDLYGSGIVDLSMQIDVLTEPEVRREFTHSLRVTGAGAQESWQIDSDEESAVADTDAVELLLRTIADLVGSRFYLADPSGLPHVASAGFTVSDGRVFGFEVRQGEGSFALQPSGPALPSVEGQPSPIWYEITMPTLKRLFPEWSELVVTEDTE